MQFTVLTTALVLALFSIHSLADVDLNPFPTSIVPGKNYTLSWTATGNYTYTIWLVVAASGGEYANEFQWTRAATVAQGIHFNTLTPQFLWTAPRNMSINNAYALYIDGLAIPFDGDSYSNTTAYFQFAPVQEPNTTMATSTSSSASHSPTTMSSTTHSAMTTSSSSSTATAVPTSGTSSGATSSTHHSSISGAAIAGIVVAILVLAALAIAGAIFYKWRRKRTAFQQREAAARANRLEPVMSEGSYEMHGRQKSETDI